MQINQSLRRVSFAIPVALVALLFASPTGAQTNYPMQEVTPNYLGADPLLGGLVLPFVPPADDQVLPITLPFPFTFYGVPYNEAYVSTNGYINFLAPNSFYNNSCPIRRDDLNAAIYAFWDDLYVDGSASVRTRLLGTAPGRQFVIEWHNVRFFDNASSRLSFEIVLSETGAITLQYRDIAASNLRERGSSATIGVESQTGEFSSQFSCGTEWDSTRFRPIGPGEFAIRFGQSTKTVAADIKPGGCPNPFNVDSKGVLPFAILGTANFDVTTIDPTTVELAGVPPLRSSFEDVGTPYEPFVGKTEPYQCTALGPDGHLDMTFKFDSEAVAGALGKVDDGEVRVLEVVGKLKDGTEISGQDVITIIKKGK